MSETLKFLSEAIEQRSTRGESFFHDKAVMLAIDTALEENPQLTSLPNGKSVLISLCEFFPLLALYWFEKRGADAWAPTPAHSQPLVSFCDLFKDMVSEKNRDTLSDIIAYKNDLGQSLRNMLITGIKCAMPLTIPQAHQTDEIPWSVFSSQSKVVHALLDLSDSISLSFSKRDAPAVISSLWSCFNDAHGAFVFHEDFEARRADKKNNMWLPTSHVWKLNDYLAKPVSGVWWKLWSNDCYSPAEIECVIPWLKKNGIETSELNKKRINQEVMNYAFSDEQEDLKWIKISQFISENNAWDFEEDGTLTWQKSFSTFKKFSFHKCIINNPPPLGLSQKSSSGVGLWDVICPQSIKIPINLVKDLLAVCPVKSKDPILLSRSDVWTPAGLFLARRSIKADPLAWVKAKSGDQTNWSTKILIEACKGCEKSISTLQLLHETKESHPHLNLFTLGVLWTFQEIAKSGSLPLTKPLTGYIELPENSHVWSKTLINRLKLDRKNLHLKPAAKAALHSCLLSYVLKSNTKEERSSATIKM